MTPLSGITQQDVDIATAIDRALGRTMNWEKIEFIRHFPVDDVLRLIGMHAAQDPDFRALYVLAAKNAGLIP